MITMFKKKDSTNSAKTGRYGTVIQLFYNDSACKGYGKSLSILDKLSLTRFLRSPSKIESNSNSADIAAFESLCLSLSDNLISYLSIKEKANALLIINNFIKTVSETIASQNFLNDITNSALKISELRYVLQLVLSCKSSYRRCVLANLLTYRLEEPSDKIIESKVLNELYHDAFYADDDWIKVLAAAIVVPYIPLRAVSLSSVFKSLDDFLKNAIPSTELDIEFLINVYKEYGLIYENNTNYPSIKFFDHFIKTSYRGFCTPGLIINTPNYDMALKILKDNRIDEECLVKNELLDNSLIIPASNEEILEFATVITNYNNQETQISKDTVSALKEVMALYDKSPELINQVETIFFEKVDKYSNLKLCRNFSNNLFISNMPNSAARFLAQQGACAIDQLIRNKNNCP